MIQALPLSTTASLEALATMPKESKTQSRAEPSSEAKHPTPPPLLPQPQKKNLRPLPTGGADPSQPMLLRVTLLTACMAFRR